MVVLVEWARRATHTFPRRVLACPTLKTRCAGDLIVVVITSRARIAARWPAQCGLLAIHRHGTWLAQLALILAVSVGIDAIPT
jgi:hypothetical protein